MNINNKKVYIIITIFIIFLMVCVLFSCFSSNNNNVSPQINLDSSLSKNEDKIENKTDIDEQLQKEEENIAIDDQTSNDEEKKSVSSKKNSKEKNITKIDKKEDLQNNPINSSNSVVLPEITFIDEKKEIKTENNSSNLNNQNESGTNSNEPAKIPTFIIKSGYLSLILTNKNYISVNGLPEIGNKITKEFSVVNDGPNDLYASIKWENFINTYNIGSFLYSIYDEDNNLILENIYVPYSDSASTENIINNLLIKTNETKKYTLQLNYINNNRNQNGDSNSSLYSKFNIEESNDNNNELLLNKYNHSIYSWGTNVLKTSNRDSIITDLKNLGITDIYLGANLDDNDLPLLTKLSEEGFDIYLLTGDPSWYNNEDIYKNYIDSIYNFNQTHDNLIKGIVFDVEPYGDNRYNSDVLIGFETYVNTIKVAYNYSRNKNVKMVNAIPVTYDLYYKNDNYNENEKVRFKNAFEELIRYSDRISLMNYFRGTMYDNIIDELELAKLYNTEIETIIEFGNVGDYISVYNAGDPFKEAINEWKDILLNNNYDKLSFSYHHLDVLLTLENKYKTYSFKFIDSNNEEINTGRYVLKYGDNKIKDYLSSPIIIPNDTIFTIELEDYTGELSLVSETEVDSHTINRVYSVDASTKRIMVPTVTYVAAWDGSIYTGLQSKGKKVKLTDTYSLEEQIYDVQGSDYAGYFIRANVYEDTYYNVEMLDENNNVIFNKLDKYEYNGNSYIDEGNKFIIAKNTPYTDVVYIGLYMNN